MAYSSTPAEEALPKPEDKVEDIQLLGKAISSAGEAIGDTQIANYGTGESDFNLSWTGEAAEAHEASANHLKSVVNKAVDPHPNVKTALDNYATALETAIEAIETAQEDWDAAITEYERAIGAAAADLHSGLISQTEADKQAEDAETTAGDTQATAKKNYDTALSELNTEASAAATAVNAASDSFVPRNKTTLGVPGLVTMNKPIRELLEFELFGDDDGILGAQAQWHHDEIQAAAAVDDLNQVLTSDDLDFTVFNEKWGTQLKEDTSFAIAFMEQLGASGLDDTMDTVLGINAALMRTDPQTRIAAADALMENLGGAYILASGSSRDTDLDPSTLAMVERWRSQHWYPELIEEGRKHEAIHLAGDPKGDEIGYAYGYYPQSQLLVAGYNNLGISPSADYFATVGADFARLDRAMAHNPDYSGSLFTSWAAPSQGTDLAFDFDMYSKYSNTSTAQIDDGLQNFVYVAGADTNNPDALQALLLSDVTGTSDTFPYTADGQPNPNYQRHWEMEAGDLQSYLGAHDDGTLVEYLIKERGAGFREFGAERDPNMHVTLGEVVERQSGLHQDPGAMAVTSKYLNSYVDLLDTDTNSRDAQNGKYTIEAGDDQGGITLTSAVGDDLEGAREHIANIMANNIDDVTASFEDAPVTGSRRREGIVGVEDGRTRLVFDFSGQYDGGFRSVLDELAKDRPEDLDIGVTYLGEDDGTDNYVISDPEKFQQFQENPTALQRVTLATLASVSDDIGPDVADANQEAMKTKVEGDTTFLESVANSAGKAQGDDAEAQDNFNTFLGAAATSGVSLIPIPGGPVVSAAGHFVLSQATGEAMETIFPTNNSQQAIDRVPELSNSLQKAYNLAVTQTIMENEHFTSDDIASPEEYAAWYVANQGATDPADYQFWEKDAEGNYRLLTPAELDNKPEALEARDSYIGSYGSGEEPPGLMSQYRGIYEQIPNFKQP